MNQPPDTCAREYNSEAPAVAAPSALTLPQDSALPDDTGALIAFIETRFHAAHRRELPPLICLAAQVEAAHRTHPAVPRGLADLLQRIDWDFQAHLLKEEDGLFPLMRNGERPAAAAILVMSDDHEQHAENLQRIRALTRDFAAPAKAAPDRHTLCSDLEKLADDLVEHIRIENNVLFPRFVVDSFQED